ncbi:MAG TPA: pyridoxamine 5'-phosphate oxidase family protein [Actinomycetota bacterium]|jgi:hypothetical protein
MDLPQTARTRIRRHPERGHYDRATLDAILDRGFVCHLGFCVDGLPQVTPTLYARDGDDLLVHGSSASGTLRSLRRGIDVSVAVTLVDGLVLAHSAFSHSINYRSAVVFGRAEPIEERDDKLRALRTLTEHLLPGRWHEARPPTDDELRQTMVLTLPIDEASAKVRTGPPKDEPDPDAPVWAGELPLRVVAGDPVAFAGQDPALPLTPAVEAFRRSHLRGD